jgi:hypothetical protein
MPPTGKEKQMIRQTLGTWKEMGLELPQLGGLCPTPLMQAVSNTAPAAVAGGSLARTFTVTATADADTTTGAIAHGLPAAPDLIELRGIDPAARISGWVVTAVDATNITLGKGTGVGSGAAPAQLRVTAVVLHSMVR